LSLQQSVYRYLELLLFVSFVHESEGHCSAERERKIKNRLYKYFLLIPLDFGFQERLQPQGTFATGYFLCLNRCYFLLPCYCFPGLDFFSLGFGWMLLLRLLIITKKYCSRFITHCVWLSGWILFLFFACFLFDCLIVCLFACCGHR